MQPSACGLGQHFQDLGHSFSLYGPPSRQITYIYIKRALAVLLLITLVFAIHSEERIHLYPVWFEKRKNAQAMPSIFHCTVYMYRKKLRGNHLNSQTPNTSKLQSMRTHISAVHT